jgi:signal peptidase I
MDLKHSLKRFWYIVWEEDSVRSWVLNIILAFVIIKFLVYPGLGLVLNTQHPIVAVVSGSMEHDGNFDEWWSSSARCKEMTCKQSDFYAKYNISKDEFLSYDYKNGFNVGDIMVLYGKESEDIKTGEILVFNIGQPVPIIHRIINNWDEKEKKYFTTKGDHNPDLFYAIREDRISEDQVIGVALLRVPYLGYIKIWFVELLRLLHIVR